MPCKEEFDDVSNDGTKGHWDKGTFVFLIFSLRTKTTY